MCARTSTTVFDLGLESIERARWRPADHVTRLEIEQPVMAGAVKNLLLVVEEVAAAQVRAAAVVGSERLAVLGIEPHALQDATLDPRIVHALCEVALDRHIQVEKCSFA